MPKFLRYMCKAAHDTFLLSYLFEIWLLLLFFVLYPASNHLVPQMVEVAAEAAWPFWVLSYVFCDQRATDFIRL